MRWEQLSVPEIEALDREETVLILPLGSVEQHGRHLPVGTDTMLATAVSVAAAKRLAGRVAVLPPPWYGFSQHHMRFAGTDPGSAYLSTDLLGGSRVRAYHDFGDLSESGTLGDPSLASAEAGARFHDAVVSELVRFIEDFAGWKIPEGSAAASRT